MCCVSIYLDIHFGCPALLIFDDGTFSCCWAESPGFSFLSFHLVYSKWTFLRHVQKTQDGTERERHYNQQQQPKWIREMKPCLKNNKRKVLCCYREYNRQPQKKNFFFSGILSSLSYIFDWAPFLRLVLCECLHQQAQPKKFLFKIVIVITVESAAVFFSPIASIDPKGKPTSTTNI